MKKYTCTDSHHVCCLHHENGVGGGTQRAAFGNGSVPKSMSKITTGREFTVEQAIAQVWGASRLVVLPPSAAPSFGSKAMITYNRPQGKTPARMMMSRMRHRVCFAATGACLMAPGCTQSLPRPVLSGKRRKVWSNFVTVTVSNKGTSSAIA